MQPDTDQPDPPSPASPGVDAPDRWGDLALRFGVGTVMGLLTLGAMAIGGWAFQIAIAAICAVLVWEIARMLSRGPAVRRMTTLPDRRAAGPARNFGPLILGGLAAAALISAFVLPPGFALPLLLAPAIAAIRLLPHNRSVFMPFCVAILLAGWGLADLRVTFGFEWMLWLALVVVATDVFGYFAGKQFGGPKFWPKVSPKKTWSGTIAGWIAAAAVGAVFWAIHDVSSQIIGISVALSMASQMGDIAESAVKRKMGVKDSSSLLPGHGGVFDRFDGVLGAALLLLIVQSVVDFPPSPVVLATPAAAAGA